MNTGIYIFGHLFVGAIVTGITVLLPVFLSKSSPLQKIVSPETLHITQGLLLAYGIVYGVVMPIAYLIVNDAIGFIPGI